MPYNRNGSEELLFNSTRTVEQKFIPCVATRYYQLSKILEMQ